MVTPLTAADQSRAQCERNLAALIALHAIPVLELDRDRSKSDRCFYRVEPNSLGARMAELVLAGEFEPWNEVSNHGPTALRGWREAIARYSLQVILHEGGVIECDVDLYNPNFGAAPAFAHWIETLIPGPTDPARVARGLVARGLLKEIQRDA